MPESLVIGGQVPLIQSSDPVITTLALLNE